MPIHPKTSGAGLGGALGILITSILSSIHGVHLTPETYAAIPTFLSLLGAWLVPSTATAAPAPPPPLPAPAPITPAPPVV